MKRFLIALFVAPLVSVSFSCNGWAQATAQISGTVRDSSGAVLPGVEMTATQTDSGISRSTVTNETGSYILSNLVVGPYRLEAALPGFRTFLQTGIALQVNSNPVINPVLEIGQVTEKIEVQANAALVETRSTAVGQVVENERILELPLNGRQVTDLITLSGAAVQTRSSNSRVTFQGGNYLSVAGGLDFGVTYSLDGAMHNNVYDGTQMPLPFPDALQEFKVVASGTSAMVGSRGSGGQVSAVTKSGTNELHGDGFEFVRNYAFNARNFFALQRDNLKRNQFGGTLGGPVVRNKLFFFGGYQETMTRSNINDLISYVPTSSMLAGDFRTFASPACNAGRQINLSAPFVGNQISPALYSQVALNIAARLPKPQDECGKITYGAAAKRNEIQAVGKVDYQLSPSHSIFGRYVATTLDFPHPYSVGGNLLTTSVADAGYNNLAQSYALGSTYLFSPTIINAFRLAVNRTALTGTGASFFSAPSLGVKGYSQYPDYMLLSVTGGFNLGTQRRSVIDTTSYQLNDDVNLVRGNHQITFGGAVVEMAGVQRVSTSDVGSYGFTGAALGLGMADFLTGRLTTLQQQQPVQWTTHEWYFATYAGDVWKVRPRLTFNYGLRWEPFLLPYLTEGAIFQFNDDRFQQGIKSRVYPNAPAGLYFPGDPGFPKRGPANTKWGLFVPRTGLAWDLRGDGRTSVRASYGISYDFSGLFTFGGTSSSPPWGFNTTVQSPAGGFEDPWRDFPGGLPFPYTRVPPRFPASAQYYYIPDFDVSPPTVQTWNLSLQKQVPRDFLITATYLGSHSTHLWVQGNINRAVFFPGAPVNGICTAQGFVLAATGSACSTTTNTNQRRRLTLLNAQEGPSFGNMSTREDWGTAQYHGLLLSVQRLAARGVNIGGNYTWSHCNGFDPTANETGGGGPGYLDPNNRNFDRGNCKSDRRQIFNLTAVAAVPQFANPSLHRLATGWRLSGIYRWSTGNYLTIGTGVDRALSGQAANQRPNQILGSPYGDRKSLNYLNPSAFAQPALGSLGNMGLNNIEAPGSWQFDLGLSRVFQVRESQKLEIRAEAFNVTNSLRKGVPNTNLASNTFGQITSSSDARIMQFALKYSF